MSTLAEVAQRARVSTATVSRVLNKTAPVRDATRKRVLDAARALNYYPNVHAQTLAGGRSYTLGMIVSNLDNPFFLDIFRGLDEAAVRKGYDVFVENTSYEHERLMASVRALLGRRLAGLALVVSEIAPELLDELSSNQLPVVFVDVGQPRRNDTQIRIRYDRGMHRAVSYLYNLGHRRLSFVGHHIGVGPIHERRGAFLRAMRRFPDIQYSVASAADSPRPTLIRASITTGRPGCFSRASMMPC